MERDEALPKIRTCTATYLDGPLKGEINPYVPPEIGRRVSVSRPASSGREVITYELVELPADGEPGKLRHV